MAIPMPSAYTFGGISPLKIICSSLCFETLFYLPTRFLQVLQVNSWTIRFESSESMLLDMMEKMFGTRLGLSSGGVSSQISNPEPFSILRFLRCYKHFFHSTLIFEGAGHAFRFGAFEYYKHIRNNQIIA